jgi:nucleoside 2-deoxyribosyltransferase
MRIYLASRYSRRIELCGYRSQLLAAGQTVQAEWLNGDHQISDSGEPLGERGEQLVEGNDESTDVRSAQLRSKFAQDDFRDVAMCDLLIAFTEPPRSSASRGGRHVELGIALGMMKRVFVVGHRENIFCWLDDVQYFETWKECLDAILREPVTRG